MPTSCSSSSSRTGARFLGFVDLFSGGQLRRLTIFALGIMPYITASIILQLLTVVYEPLAKLQKEGELGRKKITQWTRYLTVILSAVQSLRHCHQPAARAAAISCSIPGRGFILMTMLTLTTGSAFIMWLGEQITERGVGNGMSLLIFAGIVVGLPRGVADLFDKVKTNAWGAFTARRHGYAAGCDGRGGGLHRVCRTQRAAHSGAVRQTRRRTQSDGRTVHPPAAARECGRRHAGHLRLVDPDHCRRRWLRAAETTATLDPVIHGLGWGEPLYTLLYAVGIIFFAYFYVSIVFNPNEVADNMRKYGGFIPGIRPGKRTADHINEILTRITLVGALYLIIISFIPEWMITGIHLNHLPGWLGAIFERSADLGDERSGCELLLWRNFAADCGRRGHGYGHAD